MSRPIYTYKLPDGVARSTGVSSVSLVELTAEEELMATKRARNDPVRLAWELPKESLRAVDDRQLSAVDGSIDKTWNEMHPMVRSFVMQAYGQLHNPASEDVTAFLASRQVQV